MANAAPPAPPALTFEAALTAARATITRAPPDDSPADVFWAAINVARETIHFHVSRRDISNAIDEYMKEKGF